MVPLMTNAAKLRAALKRPGVLKIVGAHDALSARLIERAGFDGIWASGFAISASLKCIPDAWRPRRPRTAGGPARPA